MCRIQAVVTLSRTLQENNKQIIKFLVHFTLAPLFGTINLCVQFLAPFFQTYEVLFTAGFAVPDRIVSVKVFSL